MTHSSAPRLLLVVPEPVFQPLPSGPSTDYRCAVRGLDTDFIGFLASDLFHLGVDVHLVQPEFRRVFQGRRQDGSAMACNDLPAERIHLTRDRVFYYSPGPAAGDPGENIRIAAAFQREVMHHTIPEVQPDLIHGFNWMCGLIPALAAQNGVPCLFTLTSPATARAPLWWLEDMGIDAAAFWQRLFFDRPPGCYEETRPGHAVDLLASGIDAATHVNAVGARQWSGRSTRGQALRIGQVLERRASRDWVSWLPAEAIHTQQFVDLYQMLLKAPLIRRPEAIGRVEPKGRHRAAA
jgi:starch synthase